MKYIAHIKLGHKSKFGFMNWKYLKWMFPKQILLRIETKKGIKYARCPLYEYVKTEKLHDVKFVYPWDVWTVRIVKLRGVPKDGPTLELIGGKLYTRNGRPQINTNSMKIRYK